MLLWFLRRPYRRQDARVNLVKRRLNGATTTLTIKRGIKDGTPWLTVNGFSLSVGVSPNQLSELSKAITGALAPPGSHGVFSPGGGNITFRYGAGHGTFLFEPLRIKDPKFDVKKEILSRIVRVREWVESVSSEEFEEEIEFIV